MPGAFTWHVSDAATVPAPAGAFTLPEVKGIAVVFAKSTGEKCARCWKVLPDVGSHAHDGLCARCDEAVS